jgi:hypothetical protein
LVTVNEISVSAGASIDGAVPKDKYLEALSANLPKDAKVTIKSFKMNLKSSFTLPSGSKALDGANSHLPVHVAIVRAASDSVARHSQ